MLNCCGVWGIICVDVVYLIFDISEVGGNWGVCYLDIGLKIWSDYLFNVRDWYWLIVGGVRILLVSWFKVVVS